MEAAHATTSTAALMREVRVAIRDVAAEAAGQEARFILAHVLSEPPARVGLLGDVEARIADRARALAARRAEGEPLAYVLGSAAFWTFDLTVGPGVLIPRADTETLVRAALADFPPNAPWRVLDLGVGSGAVLAAILSERRAAWGAGVDRSAEALSYASGNLSRLGLSDRAVLLRGDWDAALAGGFDLIVSNPPYIEETAHRGLDRQVREYEPVIALASGPDGLDDHRSIAAALRRLLKPGGRFYGEIGFDQAARAQAVYAAAGFQTGRIVQDLAGRDRVISVRRPESV